jgi:hypothetical protein
VYSAMTCKELVRELRMRGPRMNMLMSITPLELRKMRDLVAWESDDK